MYLHKILSWITNKRENNYFDKKLRITSFCEFKKSQKMQTHPSSTHFVYISSNQIGKSRRKLEKR